MTDTHGKDVTNPVREFGAAPTNAATPAVRH
jgi:hypothetical protein